MSHACENQVTVATQADVQHSGGRKDEIRYSEHMRSACCESTGPFGHTFYKLQVDKRRQ